MSHGQAQHVSGQQQQQVNMFSYSNMGLCGLEDDQEMMNMMEQSVFNFDNISMDLDNGDDLSRSRQGGANSAPPWLTRTDTGSQSMTPDNALKYQVPAGEEGMPGGGPPPVDSFGSNLSANNGQQSQNNTQSGSTLTEFTKRRNWPAKVVEELKDLLHILDANGRIKHVSPSITANTGYAPEDVLDRFLRDLIHPDDNGVFVSELNESIATGNLLRLTYRLKKKDGSYAVFECVGHAHIAAARFAPNPNNQSPFCQAVLMMSRLYPTKNAALLDSFLEHKIENERLKRRIAELRREEMQDTDEGSRPWPYTQDGGRSDVTPSDGTSLATTNTNNFYSNSDSSTMPPPDRPTSMNIALTRKNLADVIAGSRPDSMRDKMARYEGASHADTIEMLTGLRYQEGERSRGITTGNASPTLVKGDAGIAIPMDRDPRTGEKKKKQKVAEEYVCTDCGTLDSPEWRKGPSGPKTLCNACGLRWAKKEKKRSHRADAAGDHGNL